MLLAAKGASDLHIAPGRPPVCVLMAINFSKTNCNPRTFWGFVCLMDEEKNTFKKFKEIDFAFNFKDKIRFRTMSMFKGLCFAA